MIDAILRIILHADEIVTVDASGYEVMSGVGKTTTCSSSSSSATAGQQGPVGEGRQSASDVFVAVAMRRSAAEDAA